MNAWLLRSNPHNKDRMQNFINEKIIAIGWPGLGDLTGLSKDNLKLKLLGSTTKYTNLELGNATSTLDIFVNLMQKDDYVLIPNNNNIYFAKINSDYKYEPAKDNDLEGYPHHRQIILLKGPISRTTLPINLRKSLKVRRTTANFSHHLQTIQALAEGNPIKNIEIIEKKFVEFTYPIRIDVMAKICIPKDITKNEAFRLSEYVKTLYF